MPVVGRGVPRGRGFVVFVGMVVSRPGSAPLGGLVIGIVTRTQASPPSPTPRCGPVQWPQPRPPLVSPPQVMLPTVVHNRRWSHALGRRVHRGGPYCPAHHGL